MRIALRDAVITLSPGQPTSVVLDVTNTLNAIDGLTARVIGLPGASITTATPLLPLFPDTTGRIELGISVPLSFPAGIHQAAVEVASAVEPQQPMHVPLEVLVLAAPGADLTVMPPVRRSRHRARYTVVCANTGNTVLEMALVASDPERKVTTAFVPPLLEVGPGESAAAQLSVRARRHILGGETHHGITILGSAQDVDVETQARFNQGPLISRGVRTALLLGIIVAFWAGAMLFGLSRAFAKDPLTKAVPPSFYTSTKAKGSGTALGLLAADAPPDGAVPKSGVVEGVGGTVSGTVLSANTGQGIGRITIEAVRDTPVGPSLVASAATGADGTYSLVGLLPGMYKLHFTALGFQDLWYPAATSESAATPVSLDAMALVSGIDATITGTLGSISGTVDTGQTPQVQVAIRVTPEQGNATAPIAQITSDATGKYTVPMLPTPGTYDLSFSAPGYQLASDVETLGGGQNQIANPVRMSAGNGEIDGLVSDGTNPLGGVTITANNNGQTVTSATPTAGAVGRFTLTGLTTPGTELLTFSMPGFGDKSLSVQLGPGEIKNVGSIVMVGGTGSISGLVSGSPSPGTGSGPLGGVTVTVNGGAAPVTTTTLTASPPGTYAISGLATPGTYTVTFTKVGYASKTISVVLPSSGPATGQNVTMDLAIGVIAGVVCGVPSTPTATAAACPPGSGSVVLPGVTVSVADGKSTDARSTQTAGSVATGPTAPGQPVSFALAGVAPGSYSVTFSLTGYQSQTVFVQLAAGEVKLTSAVLKAG
ncbi:MAG: carboxypeptidase-like regulatory domain-containing protein [Actinomycetota bacterium]|nr:carboxypeptidase-like regulatory domain-containing protein [Actinomycetota bacterium]